MIRYKMILALIALFASINLNAQSGNRHSNVLIVYYSRSGNTQAMAKMIQAATGVRTKRWPAIKTHIAGIKKYDYIFVGSPNWGSSIAPPVSSFLKSHNLTGKVIIPFMTHGGGGFGHGVADMKALCPQSKFLEGLPVNGNRVASSESIVKRWIQKLKIPVRTK